MFTKEMISLSLTEASQIGAARREAVALADSLGFDTAERGKVSIVVTEAANNLVRYAVQGEMLLRALEAQGVGGLEILALDKGPGMANVSKCLSDGYSTGGTPGNGLGAIARLSTTFDIHSLPGVGTALLARLWAQPPPLRPHTQGLEIGAVCLPKPGEEVCGDAWAIEQHAGREMVLVADGLGHGPDAAQASREAVRIFHANVQRSPKEILEAAHVALRSTRGAAAAVAEVNRERQEVRFAGIGNIAASISSADQSRSLASHNGIVGHQIHKVQEFDYPWPQAGLLILHSDGLATQWRLDRYPGLIARHPALIAGILHRDFRRGNDDITVLTLAEPRDTRSFAL